jgi:hypothetical protein
MSLTTIKVAEFVKEIEEFDSSKHNKMFSCNSQLENYVKQTK